MGTMGATTAAGPQLTMIRDRHSVGAGLALECRAVGGRKIRRSALGQELGKRGVCYREK